MSWLDYIDEKEAKRIARTVRANALQTRDMAQEHVHDFAQQARALAEPVLHDAVDFARREGTQVAQVAVKQAARAGRMVKADPVPAIVGAIGLALLFSLIFGRRRR